MDAIPPATAGPAPVPSEPARTPPDPAEPRALAGRRVRPVGLGCMNLAHGYSGRLADEEAVELLTRVIEDGADHLDTATVYGDGRSERLVGQALARAGTDARERVLLASKGGLTRDPDRPVDGRPQTLAAQVDASLSRLGQERIDLYYLHRLDPHVPVEESVGALADAVAAGKIGAVGLSEVSAATLARAAAVHPIAAVQNEYSLATRNPEWGLLEACRRHGVTLVAFSPVSRGLLTDAPPRLDRLDATDMRHHMPRFEAGHYPANLALREALAVEAVRLGTSTAALAIAWVLAQGEDVVAIPGTTSWDHWTQDRAAQEVVLTPADVARLGEIVNHATVAGARYNEAQQASVDTETAPPR